MQSIGTLTSFPPQVRRVQVLVHLLTDNILIMKQYYTILILLKCTIVSISTSSAYAIVCDKSNE